MVHVANSRLRPSTNLLRDIAKTDDRSGVVVRNDGGRDVFILDKTFAVAEPATRYVLGGLCRCRADAVDVEVELVSWPDKVRSVVYLGAGQTLYALIPQGEYSFRYRFFSRPGLYDASVVIAPETLPRRLGLYMVKAWQLARRGPGALLAAAATLRSSRDAVVATRISAAPAGRAVDVRPRPPSETPRPQAFPTVSIIVPTRDRVDLLEPCIASLDRLEGVSCDIVVVDNGTFEPRTRAYLDRLAARADVTVLREDIPFNFSRLCNLGARRARGKALLFLNDDVEALDGTWLGHMLAWLADPEVGVVGARLLYPSRDLQHGGIASNLVPGPGHPWRGVAPEIWRSHPLLASPGEVDAVTGACLLVRRDDFDRVGGFDEEAFPITLNDVDLCLKLRRLGLKSIYSPAATLVHKEGQSRRQDDDPAEKARRTAELRRYFERYPDFARRSLFLPAAMRRDSDMPVPF